EAPKLPRSRSLREAIMETAENQPKSSAPPPAAPVMIGVDGLKKTFFTGLTKSTRVEAVKSVSFEGRRGEVFGFLGPNGAGKTTTIKMLTGLIAPTAGKATLMGLPCTSPEAREKIGFLPENPYVYPYLTPREFVEMCGQLSGMKAAAVRTRA